MEVEAESREERLPLGQVFERCNIERSMRAVEIQKDDVAPVIQRCIVVAKTDEAKVSAREKLMGKRGGKNR